MISSLKLVNFRSYKNNRFDFGDNANVIVGPNTIGKTNLLEGLLVGLTGRSYRAKDMDLIMFKKPWARLDLTLDGSQRTVKIEREKIPARKFEINGKTYHRLTSTLKLPVVIFEPNHLTLFSGPPEARRSYLDNLLEQTEEEYPSLLRKYNRALSQRNALLKNLNTPTDTQLFPWNIRLSELGGQVVKARVGLTEQINKLLPKIYTNLTNSKIKIKLKYLTGLPAVNYESHFLDKLESNLARELGAGFTLYGPHREDFQLTFNGHGSISYASRGESRSAVLSLKLVEFELIKKKLDVNPTILLDDVFSELDLTRRQALTNYLTTNQSFITTTDADIVMKQLAPYCKLISL